MNRAFNDYYMDSNDTDMLEQEPLDYFQFFPVERLSVEEREQVTKLIDFLKRYEPEGKGQ
jgi:hypothetical protein